ncbi:hypothetical protein E1200_19375 [Actinomadura sp. GC306]|nr:hypothetical protein E1200_19375 [Actinomadura sp. GC306]
MIVTASAHTVPYAWGRQPRPGGLIVVPLAPMVHPDWPLAVLRVQDDGTAQGRCVGSAPFMPLRAQQVSTHSVQAAEARWQAAGKADLARYGLTVTPNGQHTWLDAPPNPLAATLE